MSHQFVFLVQEVVDICFFIIFIVFYCPVAFVNF